MWPDQTLLDLFAIEIPILQAPMAGASDAELAIAVAKAGGLGALPAGMLSGEPDARRSSSFRGEPATSRSISISSRIRCPCQTMRASTRGGNGSSLIILSSALTRPRPSQALRATHSTQPMLCIVEETKPSVVSFHDGLPEKDLMARIKAKGCKIICTATTVGEATISGNERV